MPETATGVMRLAVGETLAMAKVLINLYAV
jgi:hypothetical protein